MGCASPCITGASTSTSACRCSASIRCIRRCGRRPSAWWKGCRGRRSWPGCSRATRQLRLVAVAGPGGSILLDDTYNAAPEFDHRCPQPVGRARRTPPGRAGRHARAGRLRGSRPPHGRGAGGRGRRRAGRPSASRARWIAEEAIKAGLPAGHVIHFEAVAPAIDALRRRIGAGDVVLVKGSRGMRMDQIVDSLAEGTS